MCLISFAWQASAEYPFAFVANRDEFHARPTQALHWWSGAAIAAGKDLQAGGTWLGVNPQGRFAAITNFRNARDTRTFVKSRGLLVSKVLEHAGTLLQLEADIHAEKYEYAGFNLLFGDLFGEHRELHFASNRSDESIIIKPGIYSFSNGGFDEDWPKTTAATAQLTRALRHRRPAEFWEVLNNRTMADPEDLPDTGIGLEKELLLSPAFIVGDTYGTRSMHRVLCRRHIELDVAEKRFDTAGGLTGASNIRLNYKG